MMTTTELTCKHRTLKKVINRLFPFIPKGFRNLYITAALHDIPTYELTKGAMVTRDTITIGCFVLEKFKDDEHVLAELMAHELGHHILGHTANIVPGNDASFEHDADAYGLSLCTLAGYDPEEIIKAQARFEKWRKKGIQKSHIKTHGTAQERQKRLQEQLKYMRQERD